jgi:Tol biopolymer transport system component
MLVLVEALAATACHAGSDRAAPSAAAKPSAVAASPVTASGGSRSGALQPAITPSATAANRQPPADISQGELLITRERSLGLRDLRSGKERTLFTAPEGSFVTFPAWAPDGQRFAFAVQTPFTGAPGADWGSDLYLAEQPGATPHRIWQHAAPGDDVDSLQWTPDGAALLLAEARLSFNAAGDVQGQSFDVMRLEVSGGTLQPLLRNASDADLCPDGRRMIYVAFDPATNSRGALMLANGDGSNPRTILAPRPEAQSVMYPRLSPDCRRVVFAAANATGALRLGPAEHGIRERLALAHGSPWEIWAVNVDGSGLTRLTHFAEDEPFPQWSADGRRLLVLGTNALYELNADGSGLRQLATPGVNHGQIAWLRPPAAR